MGQSIFLGERGKLPSILRCVLTQNHMPKHHAMVDSRRRDLVAYPDPNRYVVAFTEPLRNVTSVELQYACYYKFGDENYVNLVIDEIPARAAVDNSLSAFTQLPMVHHLNEYCGGHSHYRSVVTFEVPLEKLGRLTLSFKDAFARPQKMLNHLLRFEIQTLSRSGPIDVQMVERLSRTPMDNV